MINAYSPFGFGMDEDEEERRRREMEQARQVAGPVSPESMGTIGTPPPVAGTTPQMGMPSPMAQPQGGLPVPTQISMYASQLGQGPSTQDVMAANTGFAPDAWNQFEQKQNDPAAMAAMANDPRIPAHLQNLAKQRAGELLNLDIKKEKTAEQAKQMLAAGDPNLSRAMRAKDEEGSWIKMALLGFVSPELAGEEAAKLGFGAKWAQSKVGDQAVQVKRLANGKIVEGYTMDGTPLTPEQLASAAGGILDSKRKPYQAGPVLADKKGNLYQYMVDPNDPRKNLTIPLRNSPETPEGPLTPSDLSPELAANKAAASKGTGAIVEAFINEHGRMPTQEELNIARGQPTQAPAPAATQQPAPAAAPAQQMAPTQQAAPVRTTGPVSPAAVAQATPAPAPTVTPVAPTPQVRPAGGMGTGGGGAVVPTGGAPARLTPPAQLKTQQSLREKAGAAAIETQQAEPRENVKENTKRSTAAADTAKKVAREVGTVDRIIKATEEKPQFFNILGGGAYQAWTNAQTDDARREAFKQLAYQANVKPEDRPAFQKLMNDIRRLEMAGITGSGLSASQLNTERESQRAVNAFAVSLTDTAEAAKAQAMIAKAQIDYDRAWARFLADPKTNKQLSPAALQVQFDDTIGDKIWNDLAPKLEERIKRPEPGTGRTSTNVQFKVVR